MQDQNPFQVKLLSELQDIQAPIRVDNLHHSTREHTIKAKFEAQARQFRIDSINGYLADESIQKYSMTNSPIYLQKSLLNQLLPLDRITIVSDNRPTDVGSLRTLEKLLNLPEIVIFTNLVEPGQQFHSWESYNENLENKVIIADFKFHSFVTPFQWLNLKLIMKQAKNVIFLVFPELTYDLVDYLRIKDFNLVEVECPQIRNIQVFQEQKSKTDCLIECLKLLKDDVKEEEDIVVYCNSLEEIDQIFQSIHSFQQISNFKTLNVHQALPQAPHYSNQLNEIVQLVYPQKKQDQEQCKHKVFLTLSPLDLTCYISYNKVENNITLILHLGYKMDMIRSFDFELQTLVYRSRDLKRQEILARNSFGSYKTSVKVIYYYSENCFADLGTSHNLFDPYTFCTDLTIFFLRCIKLQMLDEVEFTSDEPYMEYLIQQKLIVDEGTLTDKGTSLVTSQLPYYLSNALRELGQSGVSQTLRHYGYLVAILCTDGQILMNDLISAHQNPFQLKGGQLGRDVIIRSSLYWSKQGDCTSWIQIINKFVILLESQIEVLHAQLLEDLEFQPLFVGIEQDLGLAQLYRWSESQRIVISKMVITLAFYEYVLKEIEKQNSDLSLLGKIGLPSISMNRTLSLKKTSSITEHSEEIQEFILKHFFLGLSIFKGHRRAGYRNYHLKQDYVFAKHSFLNVVGEYPQLCIILALIDGPEGKVILYANKVHDIGVGVHCPPEFVKEHKLQMISKHSLNKKELIFGNIGQATFNELWRHDGELPKQLEEQFNCLIEPNMDLNILTVQCEEQQEEEIKIKMKELLDKIRKEIQSETKEIYYLNKTKFNFEAGANIKEWVDQDDFKSFQVDNLSLDVTPEDIHELFGRYAEITQIKMRKADDSLIAEVSVDDKGDVGFFVEHFNQSEFKGRVIGVSTRAQHLKEVTQKNLKFAVEECSIKLFWYIHAGKQSCLIRFADEEQKKKGLQKKQIGNQEIQFVESGHPLQYKVHNIPLGMDEFDLKCIFPNCDGIILDVKVRQEKQHCEYRLELGKLVRDELEKFKQPGEQVNELYEIKRVKKKTGYRVAELVLAKGQYIKQVLKELNLKVVTIGGLQVKLHALPKLKHSYTGPSGLRMVVDRLFQEVGELRDFMQKRKWIKLQYKNCEILNESIKNYFQFIWQVEQRRMESRL